MTVQKVVLKDKNDNYLFPYTDNTKNVVESMGTASILNLGVTVLYLGETDSNFTKGHIYTCSYVNSAYSWVDSTPGLAEESFNLVSDGLLARWKFDGDINDSSASPVTTSQGYVGGTTWTARTSAISGQSTNAFKENNFVYGNNILFGLFCDGNHWYSTDRGVTWTSTGSKKSGLSFANGKFYQNSSGTFLESDDGLTWTQNSNFGKISATVKGESVVVYFQGKYVVTTQGANGIPVKILTSSDGVSWTAIENVFGDGITSEDYFLQEVNGKLFFHCDLFSKKSSWWTDDLINFNRLDWEKIPQKIVYGNGVYLMVCSGGSYTSTDLATWTPTTLSSYVTDAVFDGSFFIALAYTTPHIYTSPDAITWTNRTQPLSLLTYIGFVPEWGVLVAHSLAASGNKVCTSPSSVVFLNDIELNKKVAYFNGTSFLTFTPTNFPAGASAMTMGGWFNTPQGLTETLLAYGTSSTYRALSFASNALCTYYYTTAQNNSYYNIGNLWTHWVITYDGLNLRLYINAEFVLAVKAPTTWATVATLGTLGASIANAAKFTGYLSDIRVYDRPLKTSEIKKWYDELG